MVNIKNYPCLVDEVDIFPEKYSVSKSTLLEAECLNRPVTIEEIKKVVKELFHKDQDGSTGEFYQTLKVYRSGSLVLLQLLKTI